MMGVAETDDCTITGGVDDTECCCIDIDTAVKHIILIIKKKVKVQLRKGVLSVVSLQYLPVPDGT